MNVDALVEKITSYTDEPTGLIVKLVSTEEVAEGVEVRAHFLKADAPVGRIIWTIEEDSFDWTSVNLAAFAGQGVMGRYAAHVMPILKQHRFKTATVTPVSAAITLAERHGFTESPDGGEWSLSLAEWKKPKKNYERWEDPQHELERSNTAE